MRALTEGISRLEGWVRETRARAAHRPRASRYCLGELLGRGAAGHVYLGWDYAGRPWAVKVLRPGLGGDPAVVAGLVNQRTILTRLRHPHLVGVHDVVVEGDCLAIVMDHVRGTDLRRELDRAGSFPPVAVARIGAALASALAALHAGGVLHLDVKPQNVLLDTSRAHPTNVLLGDFGVAQVVGPGDFGGRLLGTPRYIAPELFGGGTATPRCDLYSLGVTLYELCCGYPPPAGGPATHLDARVRREAGRPGEIPRPLWAVIAALLAVLPDERPASAGWVSAELGRVADELRTPPVGVQPPVEEPVPVPVALDVTPVDGTVPVPRTRTAARAVAAAVIVTASCVGGWAVLSDGADPVVQTHSSISVAGGSVPHAAPPVAVAPVVAPVAVAPVAVEPVQPAQDDVSSDSAVGCSSSCDDDDDDDSGDDDDG